MSLFFFFFSFSLNITTGIELARNQARDNLLFSSYLYFKSGQSGPENFVRLLPYVLLYRGEFPRPFPPFNYKIITTTPEYPGHVFLALRIMQIPD